jgi:hypothetical protein
MCNSRQVPDWLEDRYAYGGIGGAQSMKTQMKIKMKKTQLK